MDYSNSENSNPLPKKKSFLVKFGNFSKHKNKLILAGSLIVFMGISWSIVRHIFEKGRFDASSFTTEVPKDSSLYIAGGGQINNISSPPTPSNNSNNVAGVSTEVQNVKTAPSPSPLSSSSPSPSPSPTPIVTPSPSPTPIPSTTDTPSPTPNPSPSETPSPSPTETPSPSPTESPSPSPSETPSPTPQ